jgi:glycosyltransferase involved in cell wall biosynthesis
VLGPRFGAEKVELMRLGKLFLMPGLLGLAILDAAAAGLPTITTAYPWHSPEIAYLDDGVSGLMVRDWQDPRSYADAVTALLLDRPRLNAMAAAACAMVDYYSVEAMAERFAKGVLAALAAPSR